MTKAKTSVQRIRAYVANTRNEEGMEAAQVILILILVVVVLYPVIKMIVDNLAKKGTDIGNSISNM